MRPIAANLLLGFWVAFSFVSSDGSEDLLACVDPDIRTVFLQSGYSAPPRISRDFPEEFPLFDAPKGLTFIGSSVNSRTTFIAYKTQSSPKMALESIVAAFETSGFERLVTSERANLGFLSRQDNLKTVSMCASDDALPIYVSSRSTPRGTFISVVVNDPTTGMATCGEMGGMRTRVADQYIPNLKLPMDTTHTISSGGGRSGHTSSTYARFRTLLDYGQLVGFFNEQIKTQGWSLDDEWRSSLGQGSIWSTISEGQELLANLQVIGHSEGEFSAVFSVWEIDPVK